jgi:hypothetical protein
MALPSTYTQAYGQLGEFFSKIRDAQAPDKFTNQILKDLGYKSTNQRPYIPLMKSLGFLSADGTPTSRYHDYRSHSLSKEKMGEALKEAYSDIFLIKEKPTAADKDLILGKFKSYHNASDNVAKLHLNTFYALLDLANLDAVGTKKSHAFAATSEPEKQDEKDTSHKLKNLGLHYNIQIHLPATKDVEVYNAIFKSLNEHLIE